MRTSVQEPEVPESFIYAFSDDEKEPILLYLDARSNPNASLRVGRDIPQSAPYLYSLSTPATGANGLPVRQTSQDLDVLLLICSEDDVAILETTMLSVGELVLESGIPCTGLQGEFRDDEDSEPFHEVYLEYGEGFVKQAGRTVVYIPPAMGSPAVDSSYFDGLEVDDPDRWEQAGNAIYWTVASPLSVLNSNLVRQQVIPAPVSEPPTEWQSSFKLAPYESYSDRDFERSAARFTLVGGILIGLGASAIATILERRLRS